MIPILNRFKIADAPAFNGTSIIVLLLSISNVPINAEDYQSNSIVGVFILHPPNYTQAKWSSVRPRLGHRE
jgi:hypothetical protein